jgi:CRISPR-associated protein Csb2
MSSHLCVSIHFLAPAFHGRKDHGEPEWPPSPMRMFQSLVAAAAARSRAEPLTPRVTSALEWLEKRPAPILIASPGLRGSGYRLSVPNNAMDIVAGAWCRGNYSNSGDANPATHRTMKTARSTLLPYGASAHYLWPLSDPVSAEVGGHLEAIQEIARSIVALGWGIDMAIGHGATLSRAGGDDLPGERWLPSNTSTTAGWRVPKRGTLNDLVDRHERVIARLGSGGLNPPPPLTAYRIVAYHPAISALSRPVAAFSLRKFDDSGFFAFDPARRGLIVAGMTRHAAKEAAVANGWPGSDINTIILGHGEPKDADDHVAVGPRRFAYLPLPSIEPRGAGSPGVVGSVRRIIVTSFAEDLADKIAWAQQTLSGQELIDEHRKEPVAMLSSISEADGVVRRYTQPSNSWATVTPVVLPGYDDPDHFRRRLKAGTGADEQQRLLNLLHRRIDGLLRKAIVQAGFSQVLADHAEIEWRSSGFWPGTDLARHYRVPEYLNRFSRYHVRLRWRDERSQPVKIFGPICLGGGRFHGLGLFAAL